MLERELSRCEAHGSPTPVVARCAARGAGSVLPVCVVADLVILLRLSSGVATEEPTFRVGWSGIHFRGWTASEP